MPNIQDAIWLSKAQNIQTIIADINVLGGDINCGRVALRVDEYLAAGKNLSLGPVDTSCAKLFTYIEKEKVSGKIRLIKSSTQDPRLLLKTNYSPVSGEHCFIDLSTEKKETLIIDVDFKPSDTQKPELLLMKLENSEEGLLTGLRGLSRDVEGKAQGFLIYTQKRNTNIGHINNFLVDKDDRVYFIDAQPEDIQIRVSNTSLRNQGLMRDEIFFIQTKNSSNLNLKPSIKQELKLYSAEQLLEICKDTQNPQINEILNKASSLYHNLPSSQMPFSSLNEKELNLFYAAH